jgi:pentatricopeptide repeat protein
VGQSKKSRVAVDPKAELEEAGKHLRAKLEKLEKELAELKEGPFGPNSEFMQSLSPEDRKMALEALQKEGGAQEHDVEDDDLTDFDRLIVDQDLEADALDGKQAPQIVLQHSTEQQAYVRNFNTALQELVDSPTEATRAAVWTSYQRCRRHIPHFLSLLPAQAWDLLWQSQMEMSNNVANLKGLGKNMLEESLPLSPEQLLIYMESLRSTGDLLGAIECWNKNRGILGPDQQVAKRFWALGVRLHSEIDKPEEAQKIAEQCLERGSFADATILVPVILSWARKHTANNMAKAWACYLRFKAQLGTAIKLADYESISTTLLHQGYQDMALGVFKDRVLDQAKHKGHDSVSTFRRLVDHAGQLQAPSFNEAQVNKVSLAALTVLPRFLQNKFFYAAWIKQLIGLGEVDAASKVIELMYERGFKPDARHVNGLIGAWLRDGSDEARGKAEQLGWAMINTRIELVRERQKAMSFSPQNASQAVIAPQINLVPKASKRQVPPATIETFSVLLLHYNRRRQDNLAVHLMSVMANEAAIAPNAFIWNHWLYASLRAESLSSVWTQYETMKAEVPPDLQTFACLWDTAKVNWDRSKSAHAAAFPTARALFKEMSIWHHQLPEGQLIRTRQDFPRALHDQIIRVFCLSHDLRGALCALHGLTHLFAQYPDRVTSRILVIAIARLLPPDQSHVPSGRRGSRRKVAHMQTAIAAVHDILQSITDHRAMELMDAGVDPQTLDDNAAKQFQLLVLSDLLVVVLKRVTRGGTAKSVANDVRRTAEVMGVDGARVDCSKAELLEF